jgi:hypothetical protein
MEKEHTSMDGERNVNVREDQAFKCIITDKDILSALIGGVVPEFKGLGKDRIIDCLTLDTDGRTVVGRNVEHPSPYNGPILLDSVFDVKSPVEGQMSLIVAIEAQGRKMSREDLYNREQYYSSRLISDQAMLYGSKKELYANLRKTVAIWVMLSPGSENRNTIIHDYRVRQRSDNAGDVRKSPLDKMDIFEVNVGSYEDSTTEPVLGMLNLLFSSNLDDEVKVSNLRKNYDIDVSGTILEEANRMGALAEEMEIMREEAREDGFEEGCEEGRKVGREEGRKETISEFADHYCAEIRCMMAERGISAEEAIAEIRVPAGCRDAVLEKLGNPQ